MRISWGRVYPGQWPSFEEAFKRAASEPTDGLLARWMVQDSKDNDGLFGVTIWDNAKTIENWMTSDDYTKRYRPALAPFLVGSFSTSVCTVKFSQIRKGAMLATPGDKDG
jgi:heme-degrading monooxygenase HmoA